MVHKNYLTALEVAKLLDLDICTVYTLLLRRRIPARRISGRWAVPLASLFDWRRKVGNFERRL
ncbi:MAG: helix-turn-helix domain-containing protein [Deinococcus sp.]|nr:helix-turn-helix domain-containing protein [Deinococcus sp.]